VDKARNRAKVETRARAECPDRAVKAARKVENKAKAARAVPKVDDKVPAGRAARVVQVLAAEARAAPAAVRAAAPVQAEAVETAANCSYYPESGTKQNSTLRGVFLLFEKLFIGRPPLRPALRYRLEMPYGAFRSFFGP
jgi:hypothetical protein